MYYNFKKCWDCTSPANLSPDVLYIANSLLTDIFNLDRRYLSLVKKYLSYEESTKGEKNGRDFSELSIF